MTIATIVPGKPSPEKTAKQQAARKVTLVGLALNVLLGFAKVVIGFLAHSHALIADGVHSFTDAATDIMVLVVTRLSLQDPDEEHPYGHGKFETLGTVLLGGLLIAVASAMAYDSLYRWIFIGITNVPQWPAIVVAAMSIIGKELIYQYTLRVGKRLNSDLLVANAWHSRTDALSSIVVLLAIIGAMAGWLWLDALAAMAVAMLVAKIGWSLAWASLKELVETSLPKDKMREIKSLIRSVEGVKDTHFLRGRFVGPDIVLDIHLQVDPKISVSEGHQIGLAVMSEIKKQVKHVTDMTLHIDAEEDGKLADQLATVNTLPMRDEIRKILHNRWEGTLPQEAVKEILIHYLQGKVHLEVMFTLPAGADHKSLQTQLKSKLDDLQWLQSIRFWATLS